MKFLVLTAGLVMTSLSQAAVLNCFLKKNLSHESDVRVQTEAIGKKVFLFETDTVRSYITEKDNKNFEIEAFLKSQEMRIYSSGQIVDKPLMLSTWSRDEMLDIYCQQN